MYYDKNSSSRIQIRKKLFIWAFVLLVTAAIVVADVEQGLPEAEAEDISVSATIRLLNFEKDTSIRGGLRLLAAQFNKNIVPSPNVDGVLAFRTLRNVTFEEAMDAILGDNFKYEQKGNLIKVYTREAYKQIKQDESRMTYKVFTLYYISAAEARKLISPVLSSSGKIEGTTAAETGVPTSETISAQTGGGDTTAMNDTIIVCDFPENVAKAEDVITLVDVRPEQVLVEATILSATLTENTQLGIDWQSLKGTAITGLTGITQGTPDYFKSAGSSSVTLSGGLTIGLAKGDVGMFIQAIETVSDVTILANPKILAINKQLGQVYIGRKIGYRDNPQTFEGGVISEGEVKFLDTGTKLSFRPYIGNDGYIRMDIHPKDSSGSLTSGIPNEDSAELVTNIMVKDGQTIVIGGLFRDKTTSSKTQVPLLGDLPIVGAIFRGTADKTERQEVIVLLTPHIITEPGQAEGKARADDISRKRFGAKDQLQWIGRARLAEDRYAKAAKYYIEGDNESAMRELNLALELRPAYLEAIRLKEKIISKTNPDAADEMERVMLEAIDRQESDKWLRR